MKDTKHINAMLLEWCFKHMIGNFNRKTMDFDEIQDNHLNGHNQSIPSIILFIEVNNFLILSGFTDLVLGIGSVVIGNILNNGIL